jgi:hypothetical protein
MNRRDFMAASLVPGERFELPTNGLQIVSMTVSGCFYNFTRRLLSALTTAR